MATNDLTAFGAVLADESSVSAHVLAAAESFRATGVRTYASLQAVETARADALTSLPFHEHALTTGGATVPNDDAVRARDELRMRIQLLSRLRTFLVARAAVDAASTAPSSDAAAAAPADAQGVLADVGRPGDVTAAAAPVEAERERWRESHVAQVLRGYTTTASTATRDRVAVARRPAPAVSTDVDTAPSSRQRARATAAAAVIPKRAAPQKRRRRVVTSDDDSEHVTTEPVTESDTTRSDDVTLCPVCNRDISTLVAAGKAETHVERCLSRARPDDTVPRAKAHTSSSSSASADAGSASSAWLQSEADSESAEDAAGDALPEENDDDDEVYGRPTPAATTSRRHGAHIVDDWLDAQYEARVEAETELHGEPDDEGITISGGLRVPVRINEGLLSYQRDGLKWLWGLYRQRVGGILGDEMGLGKTAQMVALLGSLHHSGMLRCSLIVCPATVIAHWVRELHVWHPPLRVLVLHDSSATLHKRLTDRATVIRSALHRGHVLITTYEGLRLNIAALRVRPWDVVVLDEGHRIRNPTAAVTIAAKQLHCEHRFILTGAPIQNRLKELWSLFDFVYPGRLGPLEMFDAQFSGPIAAGGWSHASPQQVATAYQCALVLRDLINPYLLRRLKRDVDAQLPGKTEQVLFCRLSRTQRAAYLQYLTSQEVGAVLEGQIQAFRAVGILRKLCNHALLQSTEGVHASLPSNTSHSSKRRGVPTEIDDDEEAHAEIVAADMDALLAGSGKLMVLDAVLRGWHAEGHRVLLFSQGRRMLDILQRFVRHRGYSHLRMDGTTPVQSRQMLVDRYNSDADVYLFLLTTRVGGVGINLIGADRVIIFDPDWNPSTDMQARERAWRIGQTKHVVIYRLITAGTIEEKIYHRQIFKTVLTQKVLQSSTQHRSFDFHDLRELFTLTDDGVTADASPAPESTDKRVPTETEWLHPSGTVNLSSARASESPASALEDGEVAAAASDAAADVVPGPRLVVGMEDYHDPDAARSATQSKPAPAAAAASDEEDIVVEEHPSRARIDELLHGRAFAGRPSVNKSSAVAAAIGDTERSSTTVLQALYGQGELAGAFSHDSLELPGVTTTQKKMMLDAGARVAQAAVRTLQQADTTGIQRSASEPVRRVATPRGDTRVSSDGRAERHAGEKRHRSKQRKSHRKSTEPRISRRDILHLFDADVATRPERPSFNVGPGAALDLSTYRTWVPRGFAGTRFFMPSVTRVADRALVAHTAVPVHNELDMGCVQAQRAHRRDARPAEIINGETGGAGGVASSADLLRIMATRRLISSAATPMATSGLHRASR